MTKKETGKELPKRDVRGTRVKRDPKSGITGTDYGHGPLFSVAREGYTQRWVNDHYHNVDKALTRGWVPRKKDESDTEIDYENFSNCITRVVDRDGRRAILMEMPKDLFEKNKAKKQLEVDSMEEHIKGQAQSVDIKRGGLH